MVGANGAGKSTLLRTVCGMNPCAAGKVEFNGKDITNQASHDGAGEGLCMVPEGRQLFPELTARENLMMGAYHYRKDKSGCWTIWSAATPCSRY